VCYGECAAVSVLRAVVSVPWSVCCGECAVVSVLWRVCCGECAVVSVCCEECVAWRVYTVESVYCGECVLWRVCGVVMNDLRMG